MRNHPANMNFHDFYIMRATTMIRKESVEDREYFIKGMIQGIDDSIAKGETEYRAIRREINKMRRVAKQEAKRTQYSKEAKA